jgi:acyl-coenzyme A synthetase/AMP-(fatty) acid ligase
MKDAARFKQHQVIWTREQLKRQVEALAIGFNQFNCKPGSTIAIWLPDYVEKVPK